jgi:hypothetical protein
MEKAEVNKCLEIMASLWPNSIPDDLGLQRWRGHMTTIEEDVVLEIIDKLEAHQDFWPTWHQFHALLFPTMQNPAFKQPLFNPVTKEERANVSKLIGMMKDTLAENPNQGRHWHGGPNPCPVCGGINPDLRKDSGPAHV